MVSSAIFFKDQKRRAGSKDATSCRSRNAIAESASQALRHNDPSLWRQRPEDTTTSVVSSRALFAVNDKDHSVLFVVEWRQHDRHDNT